MRVSAVIIPDSAVDKSWRHMRRLGGTICGVRFTKINDRFVADSIQPDKADALSHVKSVRLELMTAPVGSVMVPVEVSFEEPPLDEFDTAALTNVGPENETIALVAPRRRGRPPKADRIG